MKLDREIIDLYDEYTHAPLDRRDFMARLAALTGGLTAAMSLLPLLESQYAEAATVSENDQRIASEDVKFSVDGKQIGGYLTRPREKGKRPAVIVIHENRGLTPHIKDVSRRLALAGFMAFAPDLLSPSGGTPTDEDLARDLIAKLDAALTLKNLRGAFDFLKKNPDCTSKVGVVGFCWGGGLVAELATHEPDLGAGVVYYGRQPAEKDVERIRAPLLLHYAGLDERINAGIPAFEAALKKAKKKYVLHIYKDVNHAFNNETSGARYTKQAADLAWGRTLEFLKENLGS